MKEKKLIQRGLVFGIFFVLLMAMVVITVPENVSATPTDWYVATDGSDTPTGGSQMDPWLTIGYAVAQSKVVYGDTIHVEDGTYTLTSSTIIIISTSGLILDGESRDGTIIDGNNIANIIKIKETADDTKIKDFTIKNSGNDCAGIYLNGKSGPPKDYVIGCEISNIKLEDNEYGLHLKWAGKDEDNFNTFENIDFDDHTDDSIYVEYSKYNTFTSMNIVQDEDETGDGAVHLRSQSSYNIFDDITIEKNNDGENYYDGFGIWGNCDNNEIKNSDIQLTKNGIYLSGNQKTKISDSDIYNNNNHGISLAGSDDNDISNNEIYNNNDDGICLYGTGGSDNNDLIDNEIYNNNDEGISLETSDNNDIYSNLIYDNDDIGIY
jgi:parallel beta-helix repeat protein